MYGTIQNRLNTEINMEPQNAQRNEAKEYCYQLDDPSKLGELERYFRQHQKVKRFVCRLIKPNNEWVTRMLKIVFHTEIEELFIYIHDNSKDKIDFTLLQSEFKKLDDRARFKRLELSMRMGAMRNQFDLASVKSLKGLHFQTLDDYDFTHESEKYVGGLSLLTELTVLTIHDEVSELFVTTLSQKLVNLEELHCQGKVSKIKKLIVPFARHSPKLRKIVLNGAQLNKKKLNAERMKLKDATEIVIWMPEGRKLKPGTDDDTSNEMVNVKIFTAKNWEEWYRQSPFIPRFI